MKKQTIEDVINYLAVNDTEQQCTLLSVEYINSKAPLKFRCNQCGKEFERSFTNVKRNAKYTCARCSQDRFLKINDVQIYLNENDINNDCTLLSTSYENYYTPLLFRCNNCGKEFTRTFAQVKQTSPSFKCYDCLKKQQGGYNKKSIKDVQDFINMYDINNDCELLSTTYINQSTPLLFKCNCCGKEFERTFQTMKAKKAFKCFRCAHNLPDTYQTNAHLALTNYFRSKLYSWKKEFLLKHPTCDLTDVNYELDIHHLINFSTILYQASVNIGIPLDIYPYDLNSLLVLENEFFKLHKELGQAVVLNKDIHQLFHKIYGYKNNTPEQYDEFKERYRKGEFSNLLCEKE